jgi:hypothetical protein
MAKKNYNKNTKEEKLTYTKLFKMIKAEFTFEEEKPEFYRAEFEINEISPEAFTPWTAEKLAQYKKKQKYRQDRYSDTKIYKKPVNNFLYVFFKAYIRFFVFVLMPLCIVLIIFNVSIYSDPINAINFFKLWKSVLPDFYLPYQEFVLFIHYYLSPIVFCLKLLFFPPIFMAHVVLIWLVHVNTHWNSFLERKLLSIGTWRLGFGLIPVAGSYANAWIFWGDFPFDFYKNVFYIGPYFVIRHGYYLFKICISTIFWFILIFVLKFFK